MQKNQADPTGQDAEVCEILSDSCIFADLYNGAVFDGQQVIDPDMLTEANEKKAMYAPGRTGRPVIIKRFRDSQKKSGFQDSLLMVYLAAEGQRRVHYGMPVRSMFYDAIDYARQIGELEKSNRREHKLKTSEEFLSGLTKNDRLMPVMTLAFYYGEEQDWDGPLCLHDMLDFPQKLLPWKDKFSNYPLNLVYSHNVVPDNFRTGLREVFEMLGAASDAEKMNQLLNEKEEHYKNLDLERGKLIAAFLNIPALKDNIAQYQTVEGGINMCTAFQQNYQRGVSQGIAQGVKQGIAQGVTQGIAQGVTQGIEQGIKQGVTQGFVQGESSYRLLIKKLMEEHRIDDICRTVEDEQFRQELYHKYGILH